MDFTVALGIGGWLALLAGALVIGVVFQFVGETRTGYEWLVVAIAAGAGAIFASEFIVGWRSFEPVADGLALIPALVGGLIVGVVVEVVTRYLTGGSYTRGHVTA
jgi:hypothetical protein